MNVTASMSTEYRQYDSKHGFRKKQRRTKVLVHFKIHGHEKLQNLPRRKKEFQQN